MKKAVSLLLALALALAAFPALAQDGTDLPNLNAFTALTLTGEAFTQEDLAACDLTAVNVWSVTCGPCIREMPALAALSRALPENVRLITLCLDAAYDPEGVRDFMEGLGFAGVTLIGGDGDLLTLVNALMYTPTTFFLDGEGNIVGEVIIGSMENLAEVYLEAINGALTALGKPVITLEAAD